MQKPGHDRMQTSTTRLSKSSPPRCVSPAVGSTSKIISSIVSRDPAEVPPAMSQIKTLRSPLSSSSNPQATAAAFNPLMYAPLESIGGSCVLGGLTLGANEVRRHCYHDTIRLTANIRLGCFLHFYKDQGRDLLWMKLFPLVLPCGHNQRLAPLARLDLERPELDVCLTSGPRTCSQSTALQRRWRTQGFEQPGSWLHHRSRLCVGEGIIRGSGAIALTTGNDLHSGTLPHRSPCTHRPTWCTGGCTRKMHSRLKP